MLNSLSYYDFYYFEVILFYMKGKAFILFERIKIVYVGCMCVYIQYMFGWYTYVNRDGALFVVMAETPRFIAH